LVVKMRQVASRKKVLVISRDDHIGEPIGAVFLELEGGDAEVALRVREYLGRRVQIFRIELRRDRVLVELEPSQFAEEADRLGIAASDLARKGAPRNALAMFDQALELDPLSGTTLHELGVTLLDLKKPTEALRALRRAREVLGDSAELLRSMARACVMTERNHTAIEYLERALELEPANRAVRRELLTLGRRQLPAPVPSPSQAVSNIRRRRS
jgi:tetratricopeptide (TPR) repeat protein